MALSPNELSNLSTGSALDLWAKAIDPHVQNLSQEEKLRLLNRHQVTAFDELALTLSKRYPTIDPLNTPDVVKKYFRVLEVDPSFERTPHHDKDPYDRDHAHDRAGYSRTY